MTQNSTFTATDGDGYERVMGRWSRRLARPFVEFVGVRDGDRVLDVGCGTGHLAAAVVEASPATRVEGIDASATYIDYARSRNADPRLAFRVGDACAIDYDDGTFDRVLSLLVLHFVRRAPDAIREMKRVARSGAVVAAAVWDVRGGFVANRLFYDTAAALDFKAAERRSRNYTRPMTRPGELAAAWRDAGFVDIAETTLQIRMEYASFADYWSPYLGKEGPGADYVSSLDEAERSRLEAAVRAAYLDGEDDGPRSYAALAWAIKGVAP